MMRIELHLLQNFVPSCLNRDDLNSPKDCEFGGVRRARVSSQCLKRSIRMSDEFQKSIQTGIGTRTKLLGNKLKDALVDAGKDESIAAQMGSAVAEAIGSGATNGRTKVALYLGTDEINRITEVILNRFDELHHAIGAGTDTTAAPSGKGRKKEAKSPLQELAAEVKDRFEAGTRAADIALFGRMIADSEHFNVDAACQVAHAISTHAVAPELDFFTAVDDLQPKSDPGAGMLGTQEFNSPCLYRYANINMQQLCENLGGDEELAREAAVAFVRAAVIAIPSAKQNSHAGHNLPDFVLCTVRESGPLMSLANAFAFPVKPPRNSSLTSASATRLAEYWKKLNDAYGDLCVSRSVWYGLDVPDNLELSACEKVSGLSSLLAWLNSQLGGQQS